MFQIKGAKWGAIAYWVWSFWGDEKVLEIDNGDGYTTM